MLFLLFLLFICSSVSSVLTVPTVPTVRTVLSALYCMLMTSGGRTRAMSLFFNQFKINLPPMNVPRLSFSFVVRVTREGNRMLNGRRRCISSVTGRVVLDG